MYNTNQESINILQISIHKLQKLTCQPLNINKAKIVFLSLNFVKSFFSII